MPEVQARIAIFTQKQDAAQGLTVFLQAYLQSKASWVEIAKGRTQQGGGVKVSAKRDDSACAYRMVERGGTKTRVIATHCDIAFAPKTKTLILDFGAVTLLDDSSYPFKALAGKAIAGQADQAGFDITALPIGFVAQKGEDVSRPTERSRLGLTPVAGINRTGGAVVDVNTADIASGVMLPATPAKADQLEFDDRVNIVVETRMAEFKAREAGLLTDLARAQSETRQKTEALNVKTENLTRLEGELKDTKTELQTRKAELDEVTNSVAVRANIGDVVANIGNQFTSANASLQDKGGQYKVANVKIDMKGALSDDGASIIMNDLWSADNGSAPISSVQADLIVQDGRTETSLGTVPDLTDLTESAARRVLRSVGLRPRIAYRSIAAGKTGARKTGAGQCLHQMPKPGSALAHGEDVLVVIGKS